MQRVKTIAVALSLCAAFAATACERPTTERTAATTPTPASGAATATPTPASATSATPQAEGKTVTVTASNFAFEPKDLKIEPGTTVVWKDSAGRHTVTADDKSFDSPTMKPGEEFRHTFEREGRVPYHCSLHGGAGGKDMAGTITVAR